MEKAVPEVDAHARRAGCVLGDGRTARDDQLLVPASDVVLVEEHPVEDASPLRRVYEPGHPEADAKGYVTRPNVDAVTEMTDMVAATRAFQANVTAFEATKSMARDSLRIIS